MSAFCVQDVVEHADQASSRTSVRLRLETELYSCEQGAETMIYQSPGHHTVAVEVVH